MEILIGIIIVVFGIWLLITHPVITIAIAVVAIAIKIFSSDDRF
jgi:uncharacterized membrane protein